MTGAEPIIFGLTGTQLAIGGILAGAGLQAYGQYQQGKAAQQQAKSEQAWHNYNAQVAKREAAAEKEATRAEAKQHARKAKMFQARQRALIGASGVNIEGSPLLVMEDTAEQLKLEEIDILKRGQRKASRFESQSILDMSMGSMAKKRGKAGLQAGKTAAAGSILSGTASAFATNKQLTS